MPALAEPAAAALAHVTFAPNALLVTIACAAPAALRLAEWFDACAQSLPDLPSLSRACSQSARTIRDASAARRPEADLVPLSPAL
jgi:hypothetical protein